MIVNVCYHLVLKLFTQEHKFDCPCVIQMSQLISATSHLTLDHAEVQCDAITSTLTLSSVKSSYTEGAKAMRTTLRHWRSAAMCVEEIQVSTTCVFTS